MQAEGGASEGGTTNVGATRKIGMTATGNRAQANDNRYYALGIHGPEVEKIQRRLMALGCYSGPATGDYDQATQTAVERFNRLRNDPLESGIVDPETYQALFDKAARCR
ncbi:MAG: peptidoglycan-binding protein [Acidobacteriaceae bacterium]|nr:peptidoglycan-binding protein [Acidobacteriaceae bacterium]